MKIEDIIDQIHELKPNQLEDARLIYWLSNLDKMAWNEVIMKHERDESTPEEFTGYTEETDEDTILLIPDPYSEVYRWYLEMQIDYANMEMGKYNNSANLYNTAYANWARKYHREHRPLGGPVHYRF